MEIPLSGLKPGEKATIKSFQDGFGIRRKLNSMGLIVGKKIRVVSRHPFTGPIVIRINNMQVAIGRGMAHKITVDK